MQSLVIYDSRFGNTEQIAKAIARGVGLISEVRVMSTAEAVHAVGTLAARPDLVLVGGPTHNHGPSAGLKAFVSALPASLGGIPAACFDTRYRGPVLFMGSAAAATAKSLAGVGTEVVTPPESFFIARRGPMALQALEPGEIERAEAWGRAVAAARAGGHAGSLAAVTR